MATDATRKLISDMNVDLLGRLGKVAVKEIRNAFQEKRTDDTPALKKKDVIAGIVREIERNGVKRMSDSLSVADAQAICETLEVDFKDSSKHNKNVLSKRLRNRVQADGLEEVLAELEADQQTACMEALGCADKSGTAKGIAGRIASEVRRIGAEVVFSKMDMAFLKEFAEELGLDVYDINSQPTVIQAIISGKVPAKRPRAEKPIEKISKKKPNLEAGISMADMMQHYNLSELQDFARDNGLVISGKKKEVIQRIFNFFETEEEPAPKKVKEVKKEKKGKKAKKEEKEEEVEEEAEAEEEEAVEEPPKDTKKSKKEAKETKKPATPTKKETKKGKKAEEKEEVAEEAVEEEVVEEAPKETKKGKKETKKDKKDKVVVGER